jgi:hypothetical protein
MLQKRRRGYWELDRLLHYRRKERRIGSGDLPPARAQHQPRGGRTRLAPPGLELARRRCFGDPLPSNLSLPQSREWEYCWFNYFFGFWIIFTSPRRPIGSRSSALSLTYLRFPWSRRHQGAVGFPPLPGKSRVRRPCGLLRVIAIVMVW